MYKKIILFAALQGEIDLNECGADLNSYTGVGKLNAYRHVNNLLRSIPPEEKSSTLAVNVGTCGSHAFEIGDVVEIVSFTNGGAVFVEETLNTAPSGEFKVASLRTADDFISTEYLPEEEIKSMKEQFNCFDMEGFAFARACVDNGIPFTSLKIISDHMDGTSQDWDQTIVTLRPILMEAVKHFIKKRKVCV